MENETCSWIGKSGNSYVYEVFNLHVSLNVGQMGNYIYTKIVNGRWRPIYIGQGDLGERIASSHHKAKCISQKGATHVHAHLNPRENDRVYEEKDLLANHLIAYEPIGCNEKIGG